MTAITLMTFASGSLSPGKSLRVYAPCRRRALRYALPMDTIELTSKPMTTESTPTSPFLAWYSNGEYTVGICLDLDARQVADCMSVNYLVPLGTDAIVTQDSLTVAFHCFDRIPEPAFPGRYDRFQKSITL
jgi:hypothetical protein